MLSSGPAAISSDRKDNMILKADFHCRPNNVAHHTIEIATDQLIVRRGQSFLLTLETMKPFTISDSLVLIVETGPSPSEKRGTRSEFGNPSPMYTSEVKAIWKYDIGRSSNRRSGTVTLSVTPPADAPVGKYSVFARTDGMTSTLGTLVVLFNPWCSDDWVYLPDERKREEYVMKEDGIIYYGTSAYPRPMTWDFGQFEEEMVDICLKMLDVNPKHAKDAADDVSARCNPIYVSRVVSAMVNSNGDRGVLVGCWTGDYRGGVSPTHWSGSMSILQRWYENSCRPVKYGQCWVFAAVMCTVMRFLGIPCRVVTNFRSAHDNNNSLTIDKYYDDRGEQQPGSSGSVWNFHVWVEGWMKRPDLMKGNTYDGWQVLDPTPQELSEGTYCCGPAPVAAVLEGDVDLKYDVPFVFAEVNADIINWKIGDNGQKRKIHTDTSTVGQNISTKAVDNDYRDDITNEYKYREGSAKERAVVRSALRRVNSGDDGGDEPLKVEMKFEQETKMLSGQDIKLKLKIINKDRTGKTMSLYINAQTMRYYGAPGFNIQNMVQETILLPGQEVILPVHIPFMAYSKYMVNCDSMRVSALAIDKQDDEIFGADTDFTLEDPPVSVKVLGEARLHQTMTVVVEFTNPLNERLTNCSLTVIGRGFFKSDHVVSILREVEPKATLSVSIKAQPYKAGLKTVMADFDCSAFRDIKGVCKVYIKP